MWLEPSQATDTLLIISRPHITLRTVSEQQRRRRTANLEEFSSTVAPVAVGFADAAPPRTADMADVAELILELGLLSPGGLLQGDR